MSVLLVKPGSLVDVRFINAHHMALGVARIFDLELYAEEARTTAKLAAQPADWVSYSVDGGTTWSAMPGDPESGVEFGPMDAGERKAVKVKVLVPPDAVVRTQAIDLPIGLGVDAVPSSQYNWWVDGAQP